MHRLRVSVRSRVHDYPIMIGRDLLDNVGREVRRYLGGGAGHAVVVSDALVFRLYGEGVVNSLRGCAFSVSKVLLKGGESSKNLSSLTTLLTVFSRLKLERGDAVIALGGGMVGDVAGFAAAVYLRGINYFQLPTTLLSQIDASVGGKTGVNLPAGKNLVGAFHQPRAVLISTETLATLPKRELTSGFCEMVKNGAVGGRQLFQRTTAFLDSCASKSGALRSEELQRLIGAHCAFKARIVSGDEREASDRIDGRSRRILNFGHTVAHALEAVTKYERFRHGEAVGYGMLAAGEISKFLGLLKASELKSLQQAVSLCGPLPQADDLSERAIISALSRDKKIMQGNIQWVLLERIGKPRIVSDEQIDPLAVRYSLRKVLQNRF